MKKGIMKRNNKKKLIKTKADLWNSNLIDNDPGANINNFKITTFSN